VFYDGMLYIFSMRLDPAKKKSDIPDKEWSVYFHPDFDPEFDALPESVQDDLLAALMLL
jgi:hypothetical protein